MGVLILFDIGGTNTRIGISADGKKIDRFEIIPTSQNFEEGIKAIQQKASEMAGGKMIEKVFGGIAGMFDKERKSLFFSPNLSGWVGKPLAEEMGRAFGAPVILENDAALAGLGEAVAGAGKGYRSVMYMTISTGVGGARIIDGKIDEKVFGFEPGQQIIDVGHGAERLEDIISGGAVEKRFGKRAEEFPQNDKMWDELADGFAVGLHNSILHWSPDVVVLGGALILIEPVIPLDKVEKKLRELLNFFPEIPVIKKAILGNESALYGALLLSNN